MDYAGNIQPVVVVAGYLAAWMEMKFTRFQRFYVSALHRPLFKRQRSFLFACRFTLDLQFCVIFSSDMKNPSRLENSSSSSSCRLDWGHLGVPYFLLSSHGWEKKPDKFSILQKSKEISYDND